MSSRVTGKNYSLDCMRGVACVFVVLIHCPLPGNLGLILKGIGRSAVPFFILISGFFWYKEDATKRCQGTKRALLNIVKLTVLGVLFCVVANSAGCLVSGKPLFHWFTSILSKTMILEFVVFNRAAFLSSVMYYLFGMIYTYLLVLWLDKHHLMKYGIYIAPMLLIMNIMFCTVMGLQWYFAGNWLFTCIPFFLCGYYLRIKRENIIRWKQGVWLLCLFAGILITIGENRLYGDVYCGIGTVLLAVSIFVMCIKNPDFGKKKPHIVEWIRKMSVGVFLVHCVFRDILKNVLGQEIAESYWLFIAVFVISVVFVQGIYFFIDRGENQPILD